MNKLATILFLFSSLFVFSQNNSKSINYAFKDGEWLKYRMSYSNFLNAGYSTIEVNEIKNNNKDAFHIDGHGKSTGLLSLFFKVKDNYQTFMYKETLQPYRFIRNIDEGGYTKNQEILFDHNNSVATVKNHEKKTEKRYPISENIQDMLSALYYLRNQNLSYLKPNGEIDLKMFIDDESTIIKLRFVGKEIVKTKFGKVKALKFMPMVQTGRVFKAKESLEVWVSDDENKIPLLIKASLAVGSLRADLDQFKGLAHPFNIIY